MSEEEDRGSIVIGEIKCAGHVLARGSVNSPSVWSSGDVERTGLLLSIPVRSHFSSLLSTILSCLITY